MNESNNSNIVEGIEPRFLGFHDLIRFHIREILLVASLYDSFILEEDGQLTEQLFGDYFDLNLSFTPRITRVSTGERALEAIQKRSFDLVITMMRLSDMDVNTFGLRIKETHPDLPIVLLAYDSDISAHALKSRELTGIDKIFVWTGDTKILLVIIKLIEDLKNVDHDTKEGNVRVIIVVENSRRYYSLFLPLIYTEITKQTQALIAEGLNEMHRQLRRRARPKIIHTETYEEAMALFHQYRQNILGVFSDIRYFRNGEPDSEAGFKLASQIKQIDPDMPLLLMSSQPNNKHRANELGADFLDKNSPNLLHNLRKFILNHLGFGDFVFRYPDGTEIIRVSNFKEMLAILPNIPNESLAYHANNNHFSNWLIARTEFTLAEKLRPLKISDFSGMPEAKKYLIDAFSKLRESKQRGVIVDFSRKRFDLENYFVRFSSGSLGGKARGIAFLRALLEKHDLYEKFPDVNITVPRTEVIGTDDFDEFFNINEIHEAVVKSKDDLDIARTFLECKLPDKLINDLKFFLEQVHYPLAVRSSSVLEDSQFQPFAGLYSTFMLPNNSSKIKVRLKQLCDAIKLIYASTFYQAPKAYIKALCRHIEEEQMAVIIQELVGQQFGDYFYPNISGVAQSYNYYPVSYLKSEDGIAQVALGLGKTVVEGGKVLRFSPRFPNILPQFSTPEDVLKNSQREFYALDLSNPAVRLNKDEAVTLLKRTLPDAENDGSLASIGGTYSIDDHRIYDGIYHKGPRVVTFSHILKSNIFPLSQILSELLQIGQEGMGCPVQIEFAVNLSLDKKKQSEFYFLQIRPMVSGGEKADVFISDSERKAAFCRTSNALGNGVISGIKDVIYVRPENFDASQTKKIAYEIGKLNQKLAQQNRKYLLIGPGRWGTADPWLGIPVNWDQISNVQVMVETDLKNFVIDASQGAHFFHNITSFKIGYLTIKKSLVNDFIDWQWLNQQPCTGETEMVRHIQFSHPITIKIDGHTNQAVVLMSGFEKKQIY